MAICSNMCEQVGERSLSSPEVVVSMQAPVILARTRWTASERPSRKHVVEARNITPPKRLRHNMGPWVKLTDRHGGTRRKLCTVAKLSRLTSSALVSGRPILRAARILCALHVLALEAAGCFASFFLQARPVLHKACARAQIQVFVPEMLRKADS